MVQLWIEGLVYTTDLSISLFCLILDGLIGKFCHHLTDDVPVVTPTDTKRMGILLNEADNITSLTIATKEGLLSFVIDMAHDNRVSPSTYSVWQDQLNIPTQASFPINLITEAESYVVDADLSL